MPEPKRPEFKLPDLGLEAGDKTPADKIKDRLSRLPKLADFQLPKLPDPATLCEYCQKTLAYDREFHQSIHLCEKCLKTYADIDSILNRHSEEKARQARFAQ